jgi:hypothetical protein
VDKRKEFYRHVPFVRPHEKHDLGALHGACAEINIIVVAKSLEEFPCLPISPKQPDDDIAVEVDPHA